ncbi:hypothetical protein Tco_0128821 [Tanacetum coccineum]
MCMNWGDSLSRSCILHNVFLDQVRTQKIQAGEQVSRLRRQDVIFSIGSTLGSLFILVVCVLDMNIATIFKGELGRVENKSSRGARGEASIGREGSVWLVFGGVRYNARVVVRIVGMRLFAWIGDDLLEDISMMLVLASFLDGFLVEEEALEVIFGGKQKVVKG